MRITDTNSFINKAKSIHGDKYDYSLSVYINYKSKVEIICPIHGSFLQTPSGHLMGKGCMKCFHKKLSISNDEYLEKAKIAFPDFTVLSEVNGLNSFILVKDSIGIVYKTRASNFLYGIKPLTSTAIDKNNAFALKAKLVHGDKYDYFNSEYTTCRNKVKIKCSIHGEFEQCASAHLNGQGCTECGKISSIDYNKENPVGWSITAWGNSAKVSKNFTGFKVYIIKCSSIDEEFIKIGRTYTDISNRFRNSERMPYSYEVIKTIDGTCAHMFKLENKLKKICKEFRYSTLQNFKGMHECFTQDCLELLKDYINKD